MANVLELTESDSSSDVEIIYSVISTAESSDVKPVPRTIPLQKVKVEGPEGSARIGPSSQKLSSKEGSFLNAYCASRKSCFVGMGFPPTLVDEVLEENGEGDMELALEKLLAKSVDNPNSQTSNPKLEVTADDHRENEGIEKEALVGSIDKTAWLREMGFTEEEIVSAIENFGPEISITELADSIFANRIACGAVEKEEVPLWPQEFCTDVHSP